MSPNFSAETADATTSSALWDRGSGREEIGIVHRGDDLAAGEEFLKRIAAGELAVVEDALPEVQVDVRVGLIREVHGVDHGSVV